MTTRIRLGEGGQIVIPAAHRKALGVEPGDRMTISFVDGVLRITTLETGAGAAARGIPPGRTPRCESVGGAYRGPAA